MSSPRPESRFAGQSVTSAASRWGTARSASGTPTRAVNHVSPNLGFYAQDQWTVNRFTVNAGLRFDYFRSDYPDVLPPQRTFITGTADASPAA